MGQKCTRAVYALANLDSFDLSYESEEKLSVDEMNQFFL